MNRRPAAVAAPADIPELPWPEFWQRFTGDYRADRDNAEHVTILGPTGSGKSSLAMRVADLRPFVVQLVEKKRDEKLAVALRRRKYRKVTELPDHGGYRRVYVWPEAGALRYVPGQRAAFRDVFDRVGRVGVWHVLVHEAGYQCDVLGLAPDIKQLLRLGRSNGVGLILCSQRPAWLPRDVYSQATHLFLFGTNDDEDLKRLSGLNGRNPKPVREAVARLGEMNDPHRFLYLNTRNGYSAISRAPAGL